MEELSGRKVRIVLLYGGMSPEHDVSCMTVNSVMEVLNKDKYDVQLVEISKTGAWRAIGGQDELGRLDEPVALSATQEIDSGRLELSTQGSLSASSIMEVAFQFNRADLVFPLLHGPFGEDGTVQGLFEMAGIRYVGCGVLASSILMDKQFMNLFLESQGCEVAPYQVLTDSNWQTSRRDCLERAAALGFPLFVKPSRGGSSLGIRRVANLSELEDAICESRAYDPKVIVEKAVANARDLECGVLQGHEHQKPRTSVVGEVRVIGAKSFYDYNAKYFDSADVQIDVPADLPPNVSLEIREISARLFEVLGCEGLARVDFFLKSNGEIIVNEINTMPGFTPTSMFPMLWEATGLHYAGLIDELVDLAMLRPVGLR